jgi:hypothetical protein
MTSHSETVHSSDIGRGSRVVEANEEESINQSINPSINQSIHQSINPFMNQFGK